jgi:hypothetical protein
VRCSPGKTTERIHGRQCEEDHGMNKNPDVTMMRGAVGSVAARDVSAPKPAVQFQGGRCLLAGEPVRAVCVFNVGPSSCELRFERTRSHIALAADSFFLRSAKLPRKFPIDHCYPRSVLAVVPGDVGRFSLYETRIASIPETIVVCAA